MHLKQLIENYLEYIKFEQNKSNSTLLNYKLYLSKFYGFTGNITTKEINYALLKKFIKSQHKTTYSPAYKNSILIAIRCVLKYANVHGIPAMDFRLVEVRNRIQSKIVFLEKEELMRLLEAPDIKTSVGLRDKAVLELLISTGLRCGELVGLQRNEIEKQSSITIRGKGNKLRLVFISNRARKWLDAYLKTRKDNYSPLFCRRRKEEVSYQAEPEKELGCLTMRSIQRIVRKYSEIAGITKNVTPHTLRHSFAVNLLENGANIFHIKEMLGHADICTTQFYLHATNRHLEDVHTRYNTL